jgi:hypothetical protein
MYVATLHTKVPHNVSVSKLGSGTKEKGYVPVKLSSEKAISLLERLGQ